ncbi:hypothetical protein AWENTII_000522 [Aspergillus wentii]
MGTTSVRRNLFHHNLSRNSVSTAPHNAHMQSGGHGPSGLQSQIIQSGSFEATTSSLSNGPIDNGEIVVKDKNGSYKLDIPMLPPVAGSEDGDEMEGVDGNSGGSGTTGADSAGETEVSGREKEKIEASLVEMMRNRNRQVSSEPAEVLNFIQQSLQSKVATLDEDNWMYEAEIDPQV